ncbi:MAG TPA: carotenoid oxygenase family protein [Pyrinomonadaceae bacterium]|jgi:all-trans-8'-apo-beta-carotenal 15,15'-oxygenase|nr:carotenoid oxygenase family protein [Pyrinomonadaceae bacterium]
MEDYAPLIERAFSFTPREQAYAVEEVEGEVPEYVRGTYYLNGPARFSRGGLAYRHWLDGDGMVCSLRFGGGRRVEFANRFVRSAKFAAEEEAGRPVFRTFGTSFAGDLLKRKIMLESPVNVSVYKYAGRLLAFGEQGLPVELDPSTLETRGEFNFGGALNDVSPFAAHPKIDPATGEMFNFGVAFSAREPLLNVYRFDARGEPVYRRRLPLDYCCSLHDFGLSPSFAVFYLSPNLLDMNALALEGRTLMDSLSWEPERGSSLLVVSREAGETVARVGVGSRHCLHVVNCFEEGDLLTVDVLELERPVYDQYRVVPDLFTDVREGRPVRYVLRPRDGALVERREIDYALAPDFPSVDPRLVTRPYEDFWMLGISATGRRGRKFFDELVHANWDGRALDIYRPPPFCYLGGEPVFVAGPGGRGGAVVCQIFDARRGSSAFAVFDAFDVAAGPVATLRLDAPIHLGFHASFNPD